MGLSTKQVSGDHGVDWGQSLLDCGSLELLPKPPMQARRQPPQQQGEPPLPCPRCSSTNTKFCYYNNYNKSQPRHFCRACKRHWTKGGTLRNVPVGGGRKNKRPKTTSTSHRIGKHIPQDSASPDNHSFDNSGNFLGSSSLPSLHTQTTPFNFMSQPAEFPREYPYSSKSSSVFTCLRSPDAYNMVGGLVSSMQDTTTTTTTTTMPTNNGMTSQPWQLVIPAATNNVMMEMPSYWNLDDIDSLVSTELNIPWDDEILIEIKP